MDISKLLKNVNNLNNYILATQEVNNKHSNSKIQFNMSTVLSLKKIRSLEIEYFSKCDESGAGIKILELMMLLPPSKTWGLLGKELILLLQYWLEAIRKHLILHNNYWWNFLSVLIDFIQKIHSKHTVLANILVQEITESLVDLATSPKPSVVQRHKILQCFNSVCAESSREIRFALRNKFGHYFVKLASILPTCGDIRAQFSIMETLLRWLLPRQDLAVKEEAAAKWFPNDLYNDAVRKIFLERSWQNFFKDAREFLNAHNVTNDLITTVICKRFCIGSVILISGTDRDYYLDVNCSTRCLSLIVDPRLSHLLRASGPDAVVVGRDNTDIIRMYSESSQVLITINITEPKLVYPSNILEDKCIQIAISSRSNIVKLDKALRSVFDDKYELLMDLQNIPAPSPTGERRSDVAEDSRFSHPLEYNRRKHSGYIVRPKHPVSWQSPSTASTSSLSMLRDKLTAFPSYKFNKEPVSVCALPQLSSVTEVTEATEDDRQSLNATLSTYKLRTYGVCNKRYAKEGTSQSDNEPNCMSPINYDENSVSCLLVATIGSNDSVINDTLERLPKDKDIHTDNIVELLAKEALCSGKAKLDNGIVSNEKVHEVTSYMVEDIQQDNIERDKAIATNSSDISNCVVENTQCVNLNNNTVPSKDNPIYDIVTDKQTYDVQTVEQFFSQHCTENKDGDLLISPTLAKKINQTSSESSFDFDIEKPIYDIERNPRETSFNFYNTDIVECLNDIVDKVCEDRDQCTKYFNSEIDNFVIPDDEHAATETPLTEINDNIKKTNKRKVTRIKLQYKNTKAKRKKQNQTVKEPVKRMTTIVERDSDVESVKLKSPEANKEMSDLETPLNKRKRKLYSPKDDNEVNEKSGIHVSETEDDHSVASKVVKRSPETVATSYKEIEKIRRTSARRLRNRRLNINLSPKSQKMNEIFDNLKKSVEGEEKITTADKNISKQKLAVYNFSSGSEDDFRCKINFKKVASSTTVGSVNTSSRKSTRLKSKGRNVKKNKTKYESFEDLNQETKRKPVRRKKKADLKKLIPEHIDEMVDERMRAAAADALNTSLVVEQQKDTGTKELEPIAIDKPQMEVISEKDKPIKKSARKKKNLSMKKNKDNKTCDKDRSAGSSPLPGLIIETVEVQVHRDADDSITAKMLERYKDIYDNDPLPDISEINTTQHLLSDLEQVSYNPILNITDELNTTNTQSKKRLHTDDKGVRVKSVAKKYKSVEPEVINIWELSEEKSEKTIATLGKSPITGHGDLDELPPNAAQLRERVEPRGLETQELDQSKKNYFDTLIKDKYEESHSSHSKSHEHNNIEETEESALKLNKNICTKSPTVSITRLSSKEICQWLPPRYNSIFGSNQSSESDIPMRITRSHIKTKEKQTETPPTDARGSINKTRISVISPIKMFDELNKEKSISSEQDNYLEHIKSLMTTKKSISKTVNTITESRCTSCISKKTDKADKISNSKSSFKDSDKIESSPIFEVSKKKKILNNWDSESVPCPSFSVHDWFNKNDKLESNNAEGIDVSLKDSLETFQVKRRQLYERTMSDIVQVMNNKFADLERRFQDLEQELINSLKERASDRIRQ